MIRLDCTGKVCPEPIIELARQFDRVAVGETIELWSDDPAAAVDVAAWCRLRGQELVSATPADSAGGVTAFVVRRSAVGG